MPISWNDIKEKYNLNWPISWADVKEAIGDEQWPVSWPEVAAAMGGPAIDNRPIISFTIDNNPYTAREGMTWAEWIGSEYNTISTYEGEPGEWVMLPLDVIAFRLYDNQDYMYPVNHRRKNYEDENVYGTMIILDGDVMNFHDEAVIGWSTPIDDHSICPRCGGAIKFDTSQGAYYMYRCSSCRWSADITYETCPLCKSDWCTGRLYGYCLDCDYDDSE